MKKIILYIHGKGGSSKEATFYQSFLKEEVVGVDYDATYPWLAKKDILNVYKKYEKENEVIIIANSIGAYFTMLALNEMKVSQVFFISPMITLEKMILKMMKDAQVNEEELKEKQLIQTSFDEPLSWDYLTYIRDHPINFSQHIEILYGEKDFLVDEKSMEQFVKSHDAHLTTMIEGEHWFHKEEQLAFLKNWLLQYIK